MKKSLIAALFVPIIFEISFAQDTTYTAEEIRANYNKNAIYLKNKYWRGMVFVKNRKEEKVGSWDSKLVNSMSDVEEAYLLAKQGRKSEIYGSLTVICGSAISLFYLMKSIKSIRTEYVHTDKEFTFDFYDFIDTSILVDIATIMISSYFKKVGKSKISKAIWIYNRESALKK